MILSYSWFKEWFVLSLAQEGAETRSLAAINQIQP